MIKQVFINLNIYKIDIKDENEVNVFNEKCKRLSENIQKLLKIGKYNANERVKVSKLKNDFQKLLNQYQILLEKVRNLHNHQMSELIVKSKKTSSTIKLYFFDFFDKFLFF